MAMEIPQLKVSHQENGAALLECGHVVDAPKKQHRKTLPCVACLGYHQQTAKAPRIEDLIGLNKPKSRRKHARKPGHHGTAA